MCCATPAGSPGRSAGPTPPRSASRSSTSASTTSSTWPPGSRWPRASARRAASPRRVRRVAAGVQQLEAKARGMTSAPEQTLNPPPPGDERRGRGSPPGSSSPPRSLIGCAASSAARSSRSTCCCRSSPAWRTRGTGSRTARRSGSCSRSLFTLGMFGGYVEMFRGVFASAAAGRLTAARELPDHDGRARRLADLRRGRRRRPRPAGLGAARRRGCRERVVADKTIAFLVLTYFLYAVASSSSASGCASASSPGRRRSR